MTPRSLVDARAWRTGVAASILGLSRIEPMTHRCLSDETIAAFASGALTPTEIAALEREFDACDECRGLCADAVEAARDATDATRDATDATRDATDATLFKPAEASATPGALPTRFELERVAGRGAMGVVYRARDLTTGEPVAVKLTSGDAADPERVAREARLLSELRHPAIVRYVDHGLTSEGRLYLAMEWLDGATLAARFRDGPLTVAETIALGARIASGLAEMHARGVVHRDIKPSNLVLAGGALADVRIVDLGVAHERADAHRLTMTGLLLGTPGYMAPEQARGASMVTASADVFALGAVLYQALTGHPPFDGSDILQILIKTVLEEPRPPSAERNDVPRALDDLIMAMLAKDPILRPRDAAAVVEILASTRPVGEGAVPASRAIGVDERRLFSVIHVRIEERRLGYRSDVAAVASRHQGKLEAMADGSLVVAHAGSGLLADDAVRAARSALALAELLPGASVRVVTGRGRLDAGDHGTVLDRLSRLSPRADTIRIDDVTAGFLDARFDLAPCPHGFELRGEREVGDEERTLLGRPSLCVGRDRELDALEAILRESAEAPATRKVLVVGEPGIGKSRVRRELLVRLEQDGVAREIWTARADPLASHAPLLLLSQAVLRAAGASPGDALEVRRQRLAARVGRHVGRSASRSEPLTAADAFRIAVFVGEAAGAPFDDDAYPPLRAARGDAMAMADQVRRAFLDLLAAEASAAPLLVVLEDVHWGDRASVALLDAAVRELAELPIAVLAFARPDARDLFPELTSPRGADEIVLRPLARRAAEDLVRSALGGEAPASKVERIVELARGNAFFLEELVRAAEKGSGAPPETILGILEANLLELDPRARRLLRAASVFGGVFWTDAVAALLGRRSSASEIETSLAELGRAEMILRVGGSKIPGEIEHRFRHALLREAAYATLTDEDRKDAHARAGAWLEARLPDEALVLAEHFGRGGESVTAAGYLLRGAARALAADDATAAKELAGRGLAEAAAGGAEDRLVGELHAIKAAAHRWRSELADAEREALAAMSLLPPGSSTWFEAANVAGQVSGRLRHADVLASTRDLVVGAEPTIGAEAERVKAIHALMTQLWVSGQVDAWAELLAIVERASDPDDPGLAARLAHEHARRAHRRGDLGRNVDLLQRSVDLASAAGETRHAANLQFNLVNGLIEIGLAERAEAILLAIENGPMGRLAFFAIGIGLFRGRTRTALGDPDGAKRSLEETIERAVATGDLRVEGGARMYLADALLHGKELVAAEREAGLAIGLLGQGSPLVPRARATLGRILVALGRVDEARAAAATALAELEALPWTEEGESLIRLAHAEALAAADDPAAAEAFASARANLLDRAARFEDARHRETFLSVEENAATLAR